MEVWAAARERENVLETVTVSVTPDTRASCVRAVPTATTGRRAPITAHPAVQVANHRQSDGQPIACRFMDTKSYFLCLS